MAVYPVAAGHPDYSGNLIAQLWSKKIVRSLLLATVFMAVANTDYEGEIKGGGDTVNIATLPDITIRSHVMGQELEGETPNPPKVVLKIDKGMYWKINLDDVARAQSHLDFGKRWADHAADQLKIAIDKQVLANVFADVAAANKGATAGAISASVDLGVTGTPFQLTKANILDKIVECGLVLDEQNVPDTERFIVLPAWAIAKLKQSDLKDASMTGDSVSPLRNGLVGKIDRFEVFLSNNIHTAIDTVTVWNAIFGHKMAITFAAQLDVAETLRNPKAFGNITRALTVYGFKTVKPEALGLLYIKA